MDGRRSLNTCFVPFSISTPSVFNPKPNFSKHWFNGSIKRNACALSSPHRQCFTPATTKNSLPRIDSDGSTGNVSAKKKSKQRTVIKEEVECGVLVKRDIIESNVKRAKTLKLRRWTTLGELDLVRDLDDMLNMTESTSELQNRRVNVWLVVQRLQQDYRVLGRTETKVECVCDRCAQEFDVVSDGRFEVVLVKEMNQEAQAQYEDIAEAIEAFDQGGSDDVDLGEHVRDSVLLGFPSRSLCSPGCTGVTIADNGEGSSDSGSVTYATDD